MLNPVPVQYMSVLLLMVPSLLLTGLMAAPVVQPTGILIPIFATIGGLYLTSGSISFCKKHTVFHSSVCFTFAGVSFN